ncbi:MAG: insulinase family protein [Clostridia bacterium]|nr:insulinase family protein [Clostridia bacterium]
MMKIKDKIHGFTVTEIENIPEVAGKIYMMEHEGSGARLAYLDRDESNMTFAICFRTPPKDDTGVFHIIEHSVLCGSRKFPVKEPFVELLKGSLNTFLNALTYEDRTVYPVSSRCEKDFLNLTDIYLDAVFHPKMLENRNIFLQEGWHLECDSEGKLSYNGVVYNEMKGAYSSPDERLGDELRRCLFPDVLYSYDSGGNPDFIPTLTYEDYCERHKTYYHPSNSYIFLDGALNINRTLELINSYLSEYEKKEVKVEYPTQPPVTSAPVTLEYEPCGEHTSRVARGYVYSSLFEAVEDFSLTVLSSALASTNEAPLKRKMLDTGLCKDLVMSVSRVRQSEISIELIGVEEDRCLEAESALDEAIREIAREGIDKDRLVATLNNNEFKLREKDFGSLPRGVAFALSAFAPWIYGGEPKAGLCYEKTLAEVRSLIEGDYFEKLLLKSTVDNPHCATVRMHAREGAEENEAREREARLLELGKRLGEEEIARIRREKEELDIWQKTPDTRENLDTIPTLSLSDISVKKQKPSPKTEKISSAEVLLQEVETGGISYLGMSFFGDDLNERELYLLSLISTLLKNLRTEKYTASELQNAIKTNLGSFTVSAATYPASDGSGRTRRAMTVNISVLDCNKGMVCEIVRELLMKSDFSEKNVVKTILEQLKSIIEDSLTSDALSLALTRASSSVTEAGAIGEIMGGFDAYQRTKELLSDFDKRWQTLSGELFALMSKITVRERLLVSLGGAPDEDFVKQIIEIFPSGELGEKYPISYGNQVKEGLKTPTRVAYSAISTLSLEAVGMLGVMRVLRSVLSYEYLWNEIRVKGGAYGAGFIPRKSGEICCYSYRDPSPRGSLECYKGAPAYLRELVKSGEDLTKFIIGAIGEYDVLTTPRAEAQQGLYDYIVGWTPEMETKLYRDMINVSGEDILKAADVIERAIERASVCVSADGATLSDEKLGLDRVLEA